MRRGAAYARRAAACSLLGLLVACGKGPVAPAAPPPPEVGVLKVEARSAPLTFEVIGEIRAYQEVELRPRVSGVVEKQLFRPGQMVRQGDPLFVVDTRSLDSAIAEAQARVVESEAALQRARQDVERYKPLLEDDAIPRQTYEQAVSAEKQALSVVESRREAVNRARIDRSFAEVKAPVTGQIGLQKVEVGGLATAGQTVLATVSTLDPMLVYVSIAESDYIAYTRRFDAAREGGRAPPRPVELFLADGSAYGQPGRFDFADRAVNPATGTLTLRAVVPNPEGLLRPGMTGRLRVTYDVVDNAIVIPQKAVTELLGRSFVAVVGTGGKVEQRPVKTGDRIGDQWLIEDGLRAGETVVVEGVQKARPGSVVRAMPLSAPSTAAPAASSAQKP
jgi:membrane fusion protein, multidrug efflux system